MLSPAPSNPPAGVGFDPRTPPIFPVIVRLSRLVFFLAPDIRPQTINLGRASPLGIEPHGFDRLRVLGGFPQPRQDGIFLNAFGAADTTDPRPFGQQRQTLQAVRLRGLAVVEQRSFSLIKRPPAAGAWKPLMPFAGLPLPDNIPTADFALLSTPWIRPKSPHAHQFAHHLPRHFWLTFYQQRQGRLPNGVKRR